MDPHSPLIDAYAILGVAPDADQATLKTAHRRLVRLHHPDLAAEQDRAAATTRVQEINVAYGLVRDRDRRRAYDRLRQRHRVPSTAAMDTELARRWEALLAAAGRWAGAWWTRNRRALARSAARAARGAGRFGRTMVGGVIQFVHLAVGAVLGTVVAIAADRLVAGEIGIFTPVAGIAAGLVVGGDRGSRLRNRITALPPPTRPRIVAPLVGVVIVAAAIAANRLV